MMTFTFETQGTNTYLVYTVRPEDEVDPMSLGMLTNNKIGGLAPTQFSQMDKDKFIKYNVSAKISAEQLFTGPVNKKRLLGVFNGIIDAMMSAEDYMLDPNSLLLDMEHIFVDVSSCETLMICLPVMNADHNNPDLSAFLKNIMFTAQFDQTENCDHITRILNFLNKAQTVSLHEFKKVLEELEKPVGAAPAARPAVPVQPAPKPATPKPAPAPAAPVTPAAPVQPAPVTPKPAPAAPAVPTPKPAVPTPKPAPATPRMAVPGGGPATPYGRVPQPAGGAKAAPAAQPEQEISWFYLMQHYNKENAALYKAQQEAKKNQKGQKEKKAAAPAAPAQPAFNVPGQQPVRPVQPAVQPMQPPVAPQTPSQQPVVRPAVAPQPVPQPSGALDFGGTVVMDNGADGGTVLISTGAPNQNNPHLIRVSTQERIPLNKPFFRLGREKSFVDYCVADNRAVSGSHAYIVDRSGEFFIVDTNSRNHTYVDGNMVNSNEEVKLAHGAKIRLANEDFEFKLH